MKPVALLIPLLLAAAPADDWMATWTASPQAVWGADVPLPTGLPQIPADHTVRQEVRIAIGGPQLRIVLSNEEGAAPVTVGRAAAARSTGSGRAVDGRRVLFAGRASVTILPGGRVMSDPVPLPTRALDRLAVSLWFRDAPAVTSFHWDGQDSAHIAPGDKVLADEIPAVAKTNARLFLSAVQVRAPEARGVVVAMGDSITDGRGATPDADDRWPDFLAARLAPKGVSVVNAGISGARLLSDGMGRRALARLDRDVLAQPGAQTLVLALGTNDIAWPGTPFAPNEPPMTFERLTAGYRALVDQAHARGVRVVGATITPFEGALSGTSITGYYTPAKDALRRRVNAWIRTSGTFDAVIDFDRVLADPARPGRMAAALDSGDALHPGPRGNRAMAAAVTDDMIGLDKEIRK